ncbi:MAG: hypothetical protein A4S09_16365 [Proteobacteria bacterium SG_bin7]|nr:MAG: hypothetical protein A4S09_16365 [Proteobacteria bacterium SG_bin7]
MSQKFDARQIISRDVLNRIALATNTELDDLIRSLNAEVTPPFHLFPQDPATLTLNVGASRVQNPITSRSRTVAALGADTPNFTSGTIVFPASSGGTVTITPGNNTTLNLASGNWRKATIYLDANDDLNLLFGDEAATEALANALPAPDGTLALGYVSLQNVGGTIQNITNARIYQFVGVGGAGGSGNANELLERVKEHFSDSSFEFVTPIIFANDKETLTDVGNTTGVYSVVNKTYLLGSGQKFTSVQMADAEYQLEERDIDRVELMAFWKAGAIDTAATYKVTRDGVNYQTVTMERVGSTDTYRGVLFFDEETDQLVSQNNNGTSANEVLNATTVQELSQPFTLTGDTRVIEALDQITVNKTGSPVGDLWFEIARDNSGNPGEIVGTSALIKIANLSAGANAIDIALGAILKAGSYHLVAKTSAQYKSGFSAGVTQISLNTRTGGTGTDARIYNGTTWSGLTGEALNYRLEGRPQTLKIEVTASAADRELAGLALYYGYTGPVATGVKNLEVFRFSGDLNTTEFTLTKFKPNPDLLKVYDANTGLVYRYGAFTLSGNKVVFSSGQFLAPGEQIVLIFDQNLGGAFDNSDDNALLLSENRLGSEDPTLDRSAAGEGLLLRSSNGKLCEVYLEWNGTTHDIKIAEKP